MVCCWHSLSLRFESDFLIQRSWQVQGHRHLVPLQTAGAVACNAENPGAGEHLRKPPKKAWGTPIIPDLRLTPGYKHALLAPRSPHRRMAAASSAFTKKWV